MDNVFQTFEECMEELKEHYNFIFVYHYYNKHYSQTGGVYSDIKKALDHAREDRMISSKEYKSIQKEIEEDGDYEVFQFSIEKIILPLKVCYSFYDTLVSLLHRKRKHTKLDLNTLFLEMEAIVICGEENKILKIGREQNAIKCG
jgi:hypothetical protein